MDSILHWFQILNRIGSLESKWVRSKDDKDQLNLGRIAVAREHAHKLVSDIEEFLEMREIERKHSTGRKEA